MVVRFLKGQRKDDVAHEHLGLRVAPLLGPKRARLLLRHPDHWVQWLTRIRKVKGTAACQESDGQAQVSGLRCRGARVIWRKLDCLKPNLQTMKRRIRRKDTRYRRRALRWHACRVIATFGAWSVAQ